MTANTNNDSVYDKTINEPLWLPALGLAFISGITFLLIFFGITAVLGYIFKHPESFSIIFYPGQHEAVIIRAIGRGLGLLWLGFYCVSLPWLYNVTNMWLKRLRLAIVLLAIILLPPHLLLLLSFLKQLLAFFFYMYSSLSAYSPKIVADVTDWPGIMRITYVFSRENVESLAQYYFHSYEFGLFDTTKGLVINSFLTKTASSGSSYMPQFLHTAEYAQQFVLVQAKTSEILNLWKQGFISQLLAGNIEYANTLLREGPQQLQALTRWGINQIYYGDIGHKDIMDLILKSEFRPSFYWQDYLIHGQKVEQVQPPQLVLKPAIPEERFIFLMWVILMAAAFTGAAK